MPSWCLVYRLSTCKIELLFIPRRCLVLLYHLLEYLKIRGSLQAVAHSIFFSFIGGCQFFSKCLSFKFSRTLTNAQFQFSSQCHFLQQFSHSRLTQVQSKMKAVCPNLSLKKNNPGLFLRQQVWSSTRIHWLDLSS